MKILLVSDFVPPVTGGLENHVSALCRSLTLGGDEVRVATLTKNPNAVAGVRIHPLRSAAHHLPHERVDRPFAPPVPEPIARRQLRRIIDDFRPDIIHGHSWVTVSVPQTTAPVVFTAHDYALVCQLRTLLQPGGITCTGPAVAKCISCGTQAYGRATSTALALGTIRGRATLPVQRVFAVSRAVRDALTPWVKAPIDVIPNFVAPEPELEPLPAGLPTDGFVLYVGDGGAHKGVPDLLEIWSQGRIGTPLVLATPNPTGDPLPDNVFAARLTAGQVAQAFRSAICAVVPSRWRDPCPTVVLEAMRAGTPLVATNTGGIPDLARSGREALLVEPGDVDGLAEAINRLITDTTLRRTLHANALARAPQFAQDTVARALRAAYAETVAAYTGTAA